MILNKFHELWWAGLATASTMYHVTAGLVHSLASLACGLERWRSAYTCQRTGHWEKNWLLKLDVKISGAFQSKMLDFRGMEYKYSSHFSMMIALWIQQSTYNRWEGYWDMTMCKKVHKKRGQMWWKTKLTRNVSNTLFFFYCTCSCAGFCKISRSFWFIE